MDHLKLRGRFKKFTPHIKDFILSKNTLQEWAPFNLIERVEALRRVFGLKVSPNHLREFYKTNGVRYLGAKVKYKVVTRNKAQYDTRRLDFAVLLSNVIVHKKPLIYMDETSYNTWMVKKKSWTRLDSENVHYREDS